MSFQQDKEKIIRIIKKYLPDCTIYLFGSRARGKHHPGSDIDLALDNEEKIKRHLIGDILEELEETSIPFKIDLVDIKSVSESMREQIEKEKEVWNC